MSEYTEQGWFVYACDQNGGLETMVHTTDIEGTFGYEDRDCETLEYVMWWSE